MTLAPESAEDVNGAWKGEVQLRMWGGMGARGGSSAEALRAAALVGQAPSGLAGLPAPASPGEVILNLEFHIARPTEENLATAGWLQGCALHQTVAEQASRFLFKDVTAERGLDTRFYYDNWTRGSKPLMTMTGGVYLTDFDRDGCLDMLVVDVNRIDLYKGLPDGRFREVAAAVGLPLRPVHSTVAAFVDLDGDGWEDLILDTRIFRNVPDGRGGRRFVDVTAFSNLRIPNDAVGIIPCDYDRDGHMDLYLTRGGQTKASSWVDGTGAGAGNQLWHNTGNDLRFEDVTERSGTAGGQRSTFSAVWLDADNDGWPDLYVINEFGSGVLLLNNHDGTFREKQLTDGPGDFGSMGVTCGDIDNDGNIDLYVASMYSKAGSRIVGNVRPDAYPPELMAQHAPLRDRQPTLDEPRQDEVRAEGQRLPGGRGRLGLRGGPGRSRQRRLARPLRDRRLHQRGPRRAGRLKLRLDGCRVTALRPLRQHLGPGTSGQEFERVVGGQPVRHRQGGPQP